MERQLLTVEQCLPSLKEVESIAADLRQTGHLTDLVTTDASMSEAVSDGSDDDVDDLDMFGEMIVGQRRRRVERDEYGVKLKKRKVRKKESGKGRLLYTPLLEKELGEATSLFISKNFVEASQILLDIIREEPRIPTAYETLGLVYEAMGDEKHCLDVMLIAAHLSRSSASKWKQVYERAKNLQDLETCIYALTKLTRNDQEVVWSLTQRAAIYKSQGNIRRAISDLQLLHSKRPFNAHILKELCLLLVEANQQVIAIPLLQNFFSQCRRKIESSGVSSSDSNHDILQMWDMSLAQLFLRLSIEKEMFEEGVEFVNLMKNLLSGRRLPLEVIVLFGICQLHLDNVHHAEMMFDRLYKQDPVSHFDYFIEVADAYIALGLEEGALASLKILNANESCQEEGLWIRLATCYKAIGKFDTAIGYAEKAVNASPDAAEYRLVLSSLYQEVGDSSKAIRTVHSKNLKDEIFSQQMSNNLTLKLQDSQVAEPGILGSDQEGDDDEDGDGDQEDDDDYIKEEPTLSQDSIASQYLASSSTKKEKTPKKKKGLLLLKKRQRKKDDGSESPKKQKTEESERRKKRTKFDVSPYVLNENELKLLMHGATLCDQEGRYEELIVTLLDPVSSTVKQLMAAYVEETGSSLRKEKLRNICFSCLLNPAFLDLVVLLCKALALLEKYVEGIDICCAFESIDFSRCEDSYTEEVRAKLRELRLLNIGMLFNSKNYSGALNRMRPFILEDSYDLNLMNLVGECLYHLKYPSRYRRYIMRLSLRFPDNVPVLMMCGHSAFVKRSFLQALRYYIRALKISPQDPLVNLMVGISSLLRATNRYIQDRHRFVIQGYASLFSYSKYRLQSTRGEEYLNFTEPECWYNLGVAFQTLGLPQHAIPFYNKVLSRGRALVNEAAHNLSVIYRHSGQIELARDVLFQHNIF